MKRLILALALISTSYAYNIGGAYASLIDCTYGQYGYEFGYIGTYKVNGNIYKIFFADNYCEY